MFAEAGITAPPATMDELWADAAKLAKLDADGNVTRSGISLRLSGQGSGVAEKFWILLMQYGKSLISKTADGKYQVDYNGPEGAALLARYVDSLKNKVDSPNIEHDAKAFETLATAMFARESWVIADIAANAPELVGHYGTIALPKADLGGGEYMFVPAASPNAACAWDFIKFLTDQQQQLDIVTTGRLAPGPGGPRPDRVPGGQPRLRGLLQEAGRDTQDRLLRPDPGVRRDHHQARDPPRRRLRRLRQPVGSSRQDPGAARHLGSRDQGHPQGQRPPGR